MKKVIPFFALIITISFTSCQKEVSLDITGTSNNNNNNNNGNNGGTDGTQTGTTPGDITGEWEFVKAYIKTRSTVSFSVAGDSEKTITTTEYTSADNHGSLSIGTDKMTSKDLGYSIATNLYALSYENGKLISSDTLAFNYVMPNSSGESVYKRVNADSVYFSSGFINMDKDKLTSTPGGARIKIDAQGLLSFAMNVYETKTDNSAGYPVQIISEATTISYFKRK